MTQAVVDAANAFLDGLSPGQRARALYGDADPAMRQWIYFPSRRDRNGIALGALTEAQRSAAFGVAAAMLSQRGYDQFRGVLAAEDELGLRNGEAHVNAGRYFIAIFGTPDTTGRFTVQINGHHLAHHASFANGAAMPTPSFVGTDPVEIVLDGGRVRPMLGKTQAFSALLGGLGASELAAAEIDPVDDVRVGTGASDRYPETQGIRVADLGAAQRGLVRDLVFAWVGDAADAIAEPLMQRYLADFPDTRLAWSGSMDPDTKGAYLRLDGPRLWIEFSNVGRFGNGDNHYHSVLRDKEADYLAT
ncbi:DUF3500 domain-containing protein [Fertoebacter nigrum]|uniref:DUF3500 domain-containing protein n=1 Tax=Fertoeibacter niger TaxID=2656921 RepID=A0A8X8H1P7_9RHOB|nr:DUF3500 domain-containing protein [Fertoeibacter niger]NUB45430.1 DUF3500 domain-containing protein [Fertoeibacter niger]